MPKNTVAIPPIHWILIIGMALRVFLIPNPGFEADISFWKSWGLATVDFGIVEGMKVTNNNYPTPFAYTLGLMVGIYKLFADPHVFTQFWSNTNLLFLTISKLFPIAADFGVAAVILLIGKNPKRYGFPELSFSLYGLPLYSLMAAAYLLNPVSLMDGAWWGQVDSLGLVIFLAALVLALKRMPLLAGMVFTLAMMTKLQNMIYAPVFFLFLWQSMGFTGLIRAILGAAVGFIGLNIEFIAAKNSDRILASLTENYDYFPWMSLMAYNLWWIVSNAKGLVTSDKLTVLGMINAKTVGLLMFSSFYGFAALRQYIEGRSMYIAKIREATLIKLFLENLIVINAAFFFFQTQSHDRYAYPLTVFLLLWAPFVITDGKSKVVAMKLKMFGIAYVLFSLFYFYNLHTALVVNYPNNGLPLLSGLIAPLYTISTAYVLLTLFGLYLITLLTASRLTRRIALGACTALVGGLLLLNKPLLTKQPVSLTAYTPYISEQAYGTRQTNKAVQSSFGGSYKWTRLSVQYLFYDKGIGTHANSRHVFDIKKHYRTFTADIGIDTEAGAKASAVFEVYGDDRLLFRSPVIKRYDLPYHVKTDITGVTRLTLVTKDAGDGNYDDHTDWLNPMLLP